jgi:DNA-binding protein
MAHDLPLSAMERLMKRAGAERVGEDAKAALRDALEEEGVRISKKAATFALHAGRKTLKKEDIRLAKKE